MRSLSNSYSPPSVRVDSSQSQPLVRPRGLSNRTPSYSNMKQPNLNALLSSPGGSGSNNANSPGSGPVATITGAVSAPNGLLNGPIYHNLNSEPSSSSNASSSGGTSHSLAPNTEQVRGLGASAAGRKRSSSIVSVQEIPESFEETLDQEADGTSALLSSCKYVSG